ncbi:MAG: pyridoxamine 5'-phosphate oxidase family protein [Pseudomonadota bacterium]
MTTESTPNPVDIAFSATARDIQARKGSRDAYAKVERSGTWTGVMDDGIEDFISRQRSVFLGSVNGDGQPYIQHRGGPPGFLRILDDTTIGFADFRGNKQYITQANLLDNPKAFLFLIDYETQHRLKIWGEARVVEDDPELMRSLMPDDYKAVPEQAILFDVTLWNVNCPQHIPVRFEAEDVERALKVRDERIAELESELARLQS